MKNFTFSSDDQLILVRILQDYKDFSERRFKNDQQIDEIVEKLKNFESDRKVILKSKLAIDLGITRKTLMKRILSHPDLLDELIERGWCPKSKFFYPKEVQMIKKYLF